MENSTQPIARVGPEDVTANLFRTRSRPRRGLSKWIEEAEVPDRKRYSRCGQSEFLPTSRSRLV